MALEFAEHQREGVTILALKGRITVGEVTPVREKISALVAGGQTQIVLDLKDVDYIDSTGLGNLVISYTQVKKAGGALKLLNLNKRNVELLALTRLHTIFEVFGEETDAVNSFFPGREINHFDILSFVQHHEAEAEK
ncbi:MAG TPA: STAS domain-containing protein [Bryobacteraceae bacterium]|nr:STAS domain-containing protein [Bryobacteraceae bacterium]